MDMPPSPRGRLLLAVETSGSVGSAALGRDGEVVAQRSLTHRAEHAARLVPTIDELLSDAAVLRAQIEGVVVGAGPGSFTGVRVAAATAKGLVRGLGVPLWTVSSLAAAAAASGGSDPVRYVLFDARSDRVYGACFGFGSIGVRELVAPHAGNLRDVLDGEVPPGAVFVGIGAHEHRAVIEAAGFPVSPDESATSAAEGLLRYLALKPDSPPEPDPGAWEPEYLREWRSGPT